MKMIMRKALVSIIVLLFSFSVFVWTQQAQAQQPEGEAYLVGLLEDQQNEPVIGAEVTLLDPESG
jgi:hypothetical protein